MHARRNWQVCSMCVAKWCAACHTRISTDFVHAMLENLESLAHRKTHETSFSPPCPVCRTPITSHHSIDDPMLLGQLYGIRLFSAELSDDTLSITRKFMLDASDINAIDENAECVRQRIISNDEPRDLVWNQCQLESTMNLLQKEQSRIRLEWAEQVVHTTLDASDLLPSESLANNETQSILQEWDTSTSPIQLGTFLPERIRLCQMKIGLTDFMAVLVVYMQHRFEVQLYIDIIRNAQRLRNGVSRLCAKHESCTNPRDDSNEMCRLLRSIST